MNCNRLGILTFQSTSNFGSFFQTLGLYYSLKKKDIKCSIINYKCLSIEERERMLKPENDSLKGLARYILYKEKYRKRYDILEEYLFKLTDCTIPYYRNQINSLNELYDAYIVGSDLVWSLEITDNDLTYYLDFVSNTKKMFAYGSSVGKSLSEKETEIAKEYLYRFDRISVREQDAAIHISNLIDKNVQTVCDPTMLIYDSWDEIFDTNDSKLNGTIRPKDYILLYFPDSNGRMRSDAKYLAYKLGYKIICINSCKPDPPIHNIQICKPEDFLFLIKNAALVLSGSYHGTLFSIYNRVPFYYYIRSHRSRMDYLSSKLDFQNRSAECVRETPNKDNINFDNIYYNLEEFRNNSLSYLDELCREM